MRRGGRHDMREMCGTATVFCFLCSGCVALPRFLCALQQGAGVNFASNVPTTARSEAENALLSRMKKYPPGIPSINSDIPFDLLK